MNIVSKIHTAPSCFRRIQLTLISVFFLHSIATGQQSEIIETSPVTDALSTTIWFDAEQNSLKPVAVNPQVDDSLNRNSRWLPKPPQVKTSQGTNLQNTPQGNPGGAPTSGTTLFNSGLSALNLLGWLTLGIIVVAGVAAIFYVLSRVETQTNKIKKSGTSALSGKTPDEQTLERIKHLPKELRRTDVNLRSEAQRLMQAAQYEQAIILLFAHQLLLLDRYGILRLNRGKTNRKYIRETRATNEQVAHCLEATIAAFERSYFGRHKINRIEFAEMWQLNKQLETRLEEKQEEAA